MAVLLVEGKDRIRLDRFLHERGITPSREKAHALIMAGQVSVNGKVVDKAGFRVKEGDRIEVKELPRFVSRAGYKLEGAIKTFGIEVKGKVCLDIGSSTGGFTDCLLQYGAKRVYAVDVGRAQMDYRLRHDDRVILWEETDARQLSQEHVPEEVDLITVDVSFISATKVIPGGVKFLKRKGELIVLIKPQFELCPKKVKKGVVREERYKEEAKEKVVSFLREIGFDVKGVIKALPKGVKGNEEFLAYGVLK